VGIVFIAILTGHFKSK